VCTNPDMERAVVDRVHPMIRDSLYIDFTHKHTYRSVDVLPKFFKAQNETVHLTTGMAPSPVPDSDCLPYGKE